MLQTPASESKDAELQRRLEIVKGTPLGCGSFAVVYRALWCGFACALKVLRPQHANSGNGAMQAAMLRREGQALMRHPHRFLARCYAVLELPPDFPGLAPGYTRPAPALVLELLEAGSLHRLLRRQQLAPWRPLYDTATALEWATQLAQALAHLHGLSPPVIHRDVKADNVLLGRHPAAAGAGAGGAGAEGPGGSSGGGGGGLGGSSVGGAIGRGSQLVAKLVDLGLHTSPQEHRQQRQPLFRASVAFGSCGASGASGAGGAVTGPPSSAAASAAPAPTSYGSDARSRAGGGAGACSATAAAATATAAFIVRGPCSPPLFFTHLALQGGSLVVAVDPHCPGFRNLDCPLLPLASRSPSPSPSPSPSQSASQPHSQSPNPPPTPPLSASAAPPAPPKSFSPAPCGDEAAAAAAVAATLHEPAAPPLQPAPLPPLPSPQDFRPMLVDVIPPARLLSALPSALRITPSRRREAAAATAAASGSAGVEGGCGSFLGSEGVTEVGLCSVLSGCSLHFCDVFHTSDFGGGDTIDKDPNNVDALCHAAASSNSSRRASTTPPPTAAQRRRQQHQVYGMTTTAVHRRSGGGCRHRVADVTAYAAGGCAASGRRASDDNDDSGSNSNQTAHGAGRERELMCAVTSGGGGSGGDWHGVVRKVCVSSICRRGSGESCVQEVPFLPPPTTIALTSSCVDERPSYEPYPPTPGPRPDGCVGVSASVCLPPPLSQPLPLAAAAAGSVLPYEKVFRMTGETGSCMTMAPEVWRALPYNEKADVFSFGVVLYELFSHSLLLVSHIGVKRPELPCVFTRCEQYTEAVSRGFRPPRVTAIPDPVWHLITACWDQDPLVRPAMADVVRRLQAIAETHRAEAAERKTVMAAAAAAVVAGRAGGGGGGGGGACGGGVCGIGGVSGGPVSFTGGGGSAGVGNDSSGAGGRCMPGCGLGCVVS